MEADSGMCECDGEVLVVQGVGCVRLSSCGFPVALFHLLRVCLARAIKEDMKYERKPGRGGEEAGRTDTLEGIPARQRLQHQTVTFHTKQQQIVPQP